MPNVQKDSRILKLLVTGLVLTWILLGSVRIYLFPQYAQYLYFIPGIFFTLILLNGLIKFKSIKNFSVFFIYVYSLILFQSIHFIIGNINWITFIYGLFLYAAPLTLFLSYSYIQTEEYFLYLNRIVLILIPANFILAILQSAIPDSNFNRSFNELQHLTTSGGTVRAFGTFSSAQGLSIYLLIALCFNLLNLSMKKEPFQKTIFFQILILILLNGSRTTLLYSILTISVAVILGKKRTGGYSLITSKNFIFPLAAGFIAINLFLPEIMTNFVERISVANNQENTFARLIGTFTFVFSNNDSIFGLGLGSAGLGSLNYNAQLGWIENNTQRVLVEGGVLLGIFLYFLRFLILVILVKRYFWGNSDLNIFGRLAICATGPQLLGGELFGQGSVSIALWLLYTMLFARSKTNEILSERAN
jgi:hypothetical protein